MRSILKSHRRSDSSTSDLNSPLEAAFTKPPLFKSNASPKIPNSPNMNPPLSVVTSSQPTLSSPKKLLTPIKKMLSHHSKPNPSTQTADALSSVVLEEFVPPRNRRTLNREGTSSDLSEHRSSDNSASYSRLSNAYSSSHSLDPHSRPGPDQERFLEKSPALSRRNSLNASESQNHEKALYGNPDMPMNSSELSIATSKDSTQILGSAVLPGKWVGIDKEVSYEADNDSKDSDSSSQFSFVKDVRGGRNTSVKYYKKRTSQPNSERAGISHNYFSLHDTEFEAASLSDYDFENNGIIEDDADDEYPESSHRYNDFMSDSTPNRPLDKSDINDKSVTQNSANEVAPSQNFNFDTPLTNIDISEIVHPGSDSPGYGDDILDTYLDSAKSPPFETTRDFSHAMDIESKSSSSLEGRLKARSHSASELKDDKNKDSMDSSVGAMSNIMTTLIKLENDSTTALQSPIKFQSRYASNINPSPRSEESQAFFTKSPDSTTNQNRTSIADMMSTLTMLDNQCKMSTESTISASKKYPEIRKRYSWIANENSEVKNENEKSFDYDESTKPGHTSIFDEDLLDEINLLPENFDFNDDIDSNSTEQDVPYFFRSKSYNQKPKKFLFDHNYQENKIELSNKVVTFYRSKSMDRPSIYGGLSPTRGASIRSKTSFNDENISEADEDSDLGESAKHVLLDQKLGHLSQFSSNDLTSQRSVNLIAITEIATPKLQ